MSILSFLFCFWLFASAFSTIYIIFGSLLDSISGFQNLYYSWADCIAFTGNGQEVAPLVRSLVVGFLALLFLKVQNSLVSLAWRHVFGSCVCVCRLSNDISTISLLFRKLPDNVHPKTASKPRNFSQKPQARNSDGSVRAPEVNVSVKENNRFVNYTAYEENICQLLGQAGLLRVRHQTLDTPETHH